MWECPCVAFVDLIFFFFIFFWWEDCFRFWCLPSISSAYAGYFPLGSGCAVVWVYDMCTLPGGHLAPSHGCLGSGGEPCTLQGRWGKWPAPTHRTLGGGSGTCLRLPLESEVAASAYTHPWSSCRQYPATSEYTEKEAPMGACSSTWVSPTMPS